MDFRRMTRVYWVVWAVVALIGPLAVAGPASAQTPTASILGTVLDPQGLPVEGANVALTNQGTNYTYNTATSSTGAFQFSSIDSGLYRVTVTASNFRVAVVENIKVDTATNYSVPPIKLEVGSAKETITVEAGAEVVNTTDTEVASTVDKKQIEDLPILDRNPLNLPFSSQAQEFTVINQNAGLEDGGGSSQVSIVTPKGTNNWHGQGFWNYRTNGWAANDWFNDASGVPLGRLVRNQGGGNLGGPIKKDKLFVYGWYELLRLKQEAPNNTTVISPTIFNALTSANPTLPFTYQPIDPNTGTPDPGGPKTINLL